jgi:hypothetical protein
MRTSESGATLTTVITPSSLRLVQPPALDLGVIATSRKPDERRAPIHPAHLDRIDAELRQRIFLERGYGERFGVPDSTLETQVGGLGSREELLRACDVVMLPQARAR